MLTTVDISAVNTTKRRSTSHKGLYAMEVDCPWTVNVARMMSLFVVHTRNAPLLCRQVTDFLTCAPTFIEWLIIQTHIGTWVFVPRFSNFMLTLFGRKGEGEDIF